MAQWLHSDWVSGLLCGFLFGFILENSGFGSPTKLTAQFHLRDWAVFKVMFTAIVVSGAGLYGLEAVGIVDAQGIFVPTSLLVAAAAGGALVGAGFAIGGYCPGTSVVGLFSGRLDAFVFVVGLIIGTLGFAGLYGPTVERILALGEVESGDTITDIFGVSQPVVLMVMAAVLLLVFYAGSWFERRSHGPITAEHAVAGSGAHPHS